MVKKSSATAGLEMWRSSYVRVSDGIIGIDRFELSCLEVLLISEATRIRDVVSL